LKPLGIDLFCGLGGWTEGLLSEGYEVVGFDIEHVYGSARYPAQLVLQDVLTLHGSQFKDAALIVASPPCQFFSYCAMPWKRAKQLAADVRADPTRLEKELALFNACFRIQREASEAAGRRIPLVVENVKGAQPWVGRAQANFGSFYLWGDIAMVGKRIVPPCPEFGAPDTRAYRGIAEKFNPDGTEHPQGSWFAVADSKNRGSRKNDGGSWFNIGSPGQTETNRNPVNGRKVEGMNFHDYEKTGQPGRSFQSAVAETGAKVSGDWFGSYADMKANGTISPGRLFGKGSQARKEASAQIARIPFELARYIASVFKPR
jgi:hypothetical protein